ncbi:hypothetical protein [Flavobacterium cerinum]|uniref:Uncharacterized protein n=1 Tax=Flavobacterium cerinum TaxID=2502784 RepID=A0ABY5IN32_9FLAO|nr:hypothetical protein [Flavobacterium cerinum]UUC44200.1 hypothetical protein NOX80_11205 [Flavobacterium cerinum]
MEMLIEKLKDKGYDVSAFQTNGGFNGSLRDSVNRYLEASLLGLEKGLVNEISLRTYLEYNGEDKPYTEAYMKVKYNGHAFNITQMQINRNSRDGAKMKEINLKGETAALLPPFKEIMAMAIEDKKKVVRKFNR